MFMPNSPRPPRGMAKRELVVLLKEASAPERKGRIAHGKRPALRERRAPGRLVLASADEEMDDGNEDDGADGGRGERIPESAAENAELQEEPAADKRADDAEDDVRDAAVAAAASEFAGKPAGDEANENPADETLLLADDNDAFLEQHGESSEHGASLAAKGWGILAQQPGRKKEQRPEDGEARQRQLRGETSGRRESAASCNGWCRDRGRGRGRECR